MTKITSILIYEIQKDNLGRNYGINILKVKLTLPGAPWLFSLEQTQGEPKIAHDEHLDNCHGATKAALQAAERRRKKQPLSRMTDIWRSRICGPPIMKALQSMRKLKYLSILRFAILVV